MKALVLFSGGLDSILAIKLLQKQGLEVLAYHFTSPVLTEDITRLKKTAKEIGVKLIIEEAKEELKKNTRRYAKRQLTWFRSDKRIEWIDAARDVDEIVGEILEKIRSAAFYKNGIPAKVLWETEEKRLLKIMNLLI